MQRKKHTPRVVNKTSLVLEHLQKNGTITSWEAIEQYNVTRLSAIIFNLRKNYRIDSLDKTHIDKYGNKTTFTQYVYHGAA